MSSCSLSVLLILCMLYKRKKKTLVCELLEQAGRYPHCRHCTVLPESKKLEGKKISNSIWEPFENGHFSRLQEMPISRWDHFNDPLGPESTAVSSWRISLSSAEGLSANLLLYVQLLTSDSLEHGTFQIRINLTHLQN